MSTKCIKKVSTKKFSVKTVSKWLTENERRVFCNVVENGDILEVRDEVLHNWGICMKTTSKEFNSIQVVYLKKENDKDPGKIVLDPLDQFWYKGSEIRINNGTDKTHQHHSEEDIMQQIEHALRHKSRKWHSSEHFAFWCRHGEKATNKRQLSEVGKWGSLSASAGVWMFMRKRHNTQ